MDKRGCFERNLAALEARDPALCSRLSREAGSGDGRYRFPESRSGEIVPALVDTAGTSRPLHSMMDPRREGERLISTLGEEGFLVFLGLGGAFAVEAALGRAGVSRVVVIDYDISGAAELFRSREYVTILRDPRFTLLVDPAPEAVETCILEQYLPAVCGGVRVFPLRTRMAADVSRFSAAAAAIERSIETISRDYSVQAHFGMRWFSNIIRNLKTAGTQNDVLPPAREAAICAAGPSLDEQIPLLLEERSKQGACIISADTALPALLSGGVTPDAVVSIDCQHISYYHFMGCLPLTVPLFLDIASPPLVAGFSLSPFFFSGGHPLAQYISREWRPLRQLDISGGNVTYACLSLAEHLGARRIRVYGADFSYPGGRVYARGTYLFPFFEKKQNRFTSLETLFSAFLYRSPFLSSEGGTNADLYETASLKFYRNAFERKSSIMDAEIIPVPGKGAPITITKQKIPGRTENSLTAALTGNARTTPEEFLKQYQTAVAALPVPGSGGYVREDGIEEQRIFTTLLPLAAALRRRRPELKTGELIEEVKRFCVNSIDRVLATGVSAHVNQGNGL